MGGGEGSLFRNGWKLSIAMRSAGAAFGQIKRSRF